MRRAVGFALILVMICSSFLWALAETPLDVSELYKDRDLEDTWKQEDVEMISLSENGVEVSDSEIISVEEGKIIILEEGDYLLTGNWEGQIVIDVSEEEKVRLILQNVTIDSPFGPAIFEKSADKLILTLDGGSINRLSDRTEEIDEDDTAGAVIYAQDDLSINGTGTLMIEGRAKNGIHSKADLIIASGDLQVKAVNDAVKGRNSVLVLGGSLSVTCDGDGIVSNRENKDEKGWIVIDGGTVTVTTGSGAEIGKKKEGSSRKGIKAAADLTILDGKIILDTEDDGIHAANVTITGGSIEISSGDDAIQADGKLRILSGDILIGKCKKETKGEDVEIAEGVIRTAAE